MKDIVRDKALIKMTKGFPGLTAEQERLVKDAEMRVMLDHLRKQWRWYWNRHLDWTASPSSFRAGYNAALDALRKEMEGGNNAD